MSLRHVHIPHTTRYARSAARLLVALTMAVVGLVGLAGPASAHHPEITGSSKCDGLVHYTARAWSTQDSAARTHYDIRVYKSVNGGGWVEVQRGQFVSGNSYQFSGTTSAPAAGSSVRLLVKAYGNWANGTAGNQTWTTDPIYPATNCTVSSPTAGSISHTCSSWSVQLNNTASNVAVTYTITVNTVAKQVTVGAGQVHNYSAPVVEDTSYTVSVAANNKVLASRSFTVNCVTSSPTAGAITHDCSKWSALLDNSASNVAVTYTVTVNGVATQVTVPAGAKQTHSGPVAEDTTNTVTVAANGNVLQSSTFTVNCVTSSPTAAAIAHDCSAWSVQLNNTASNVPVTYTITVNGASQQVTVPAGTTVTHTGPVGEDTTNTVSVAANGTVLQTSTFTVNCVTPTTPPTTPPTTTVPTDTEVLEESASGKAVGSLRVSCQGTVRVTMRNRSTERVTYKVKIGKRSEKISVASGKTRTWVTSAAPRQRAQLWMGAELLDTKRLPRACVAPDVLPDTGQRG